MLTYSYMRQDAVHSHHKYGWTWFYEQSADIKNLIKRLHPNYKEQINIPISGYMQTQILQKEAGVAQPVRLLILEKGVV